jgi:glycosyltransferase involved in cell wall biosynthesis
MKILLVAYSSHDYEYAKNTGTKGVVDDIHNKLVADNHQVDVISNYTDLNRSVIKRGQTSKLITQYTSNNKYEAIMIHQIHFIIGPILSALSSSPSTTVIVTFHLPPASILSYNLGFKELNNVLESNPEYVSRLKLTFVTPVGRFYEQSFKILDLYPVIKSISFAVLNPISDINPSTEYVERDIDLVFIGRLEPHRDPKLIIRIAKDNPSKNIYVVGGLSKSDAEYSESIIDNMSKVSNITYLGPVPKKTVYDILSRCKFFLMNSKFEASSIAVLEALYHGVKVINVRTPSVKTMELESIFDDFIYQYDEETYNPRKIVKYNLDDYEEATNDSRLIMQKELLKYYSIDKVTSEYINLIDDLHV